MKYWEIIHTTTHNGFDIVISKTWEDIHPKDFFDDSVDDVSEICNKIDLGLLDWFIVRFQASKSGVVLGEDYLGGLLYDNAQDFIKDSGGYLEDMLEQCTQQAKKKLSEIIETV